MPKKEFIGWCQKGCQTFWHEAGAWRRGWILVFIPPKSAQVNFLWGKNDVRTAIQQFYTTPQKKLLYPQKQISGYAPGMRPDIPESYGRKNYRVHRFRTNEKRKSWFTWKIAVKWYACVFWVVSGPLINQSIKSNLYSAICRKRIISVCWRSYSRRNCIRQCAYAHNVQSA